MSEPRLALEGGDAGTAVAVPASARGLAARARLGWLTLPPAFLWWAFFLVTPIGLILVSSFFRRGPFGGVVYEFTWSNYARAIDPLYLKVLWYSVRMALITTAICLVVGYPAAYFIATRTSARVRNALLVLVILPFWTNFLIRTYSWIVLLNREGVINRTLQSAGITDGPLPLLYNDFAIVLGLVYGYLPLMILPLYAALERLNPEVREAAEDLGSRPLRILRTVTLPLITPGIVAGCVFVFVPSLGNFPVPQLLGGGRRIMMGNLINQQFLEARDWPFGSTLALMLMAILMILLVIQSRVLRKGREIGIDA
jgi:spermidine/putrescine transport system permease protein